LFSPLANAGTVGASLISVGSSFQSRIARGKNEFMWCFVFEWEKRNLLFRVVVRWLWSTLTCLLCILCSIVRLAWFLRCSRVDHFNSLSMFVTLLVYSSQVKSNISLLSVYRKQPTIKKYLTWLDLTTQAVSQTCSES